MSILNKFRIPDCKVWKHEAIHPSSTKGVDVTTFTIGV